MEIETKTEGLERSTIFHLVKEVIGFVLYMHQQIPSVLQNLELEFDTLREECKNLELVQTQSELKAISRRQHNGRIRVVKQSIKRLEKLMNGISKLLSAFELILNEIPNISRIVLILGGSPIRPHHVYELSFSHGQVVSASEKNCTKCKTTGLLSKKVIRALLSNGAGSVSYAGPMKLFLLVRAPPAFNLSQDFIPKRDFRYGKKVVPLTVQIKCRSQNQDIGESEKNCQAENFIALPDPTSSNFIWFQCRHSIKGLALQAPFSDK